MKNNLCLDPSLPLEAEIVEIIHNSSTIFTLKLRFVEPECKKFFYFHPGQFNMLYLYGVGEVAISIVSDPKEKNIFSHTIRAIGRVTSAMQKLVAGDKIGVRGPFGIGWPLDEAKEKDIVIITGGLGCAPSVSVINYIIARREQYGSLKILQGVKHSDDFIFQKQYVKWKSHKNTEVFVAADVAGPRWPWGVGYVTDMIESIELKEDNTIAMMCGPRMMMHSAINALNKKNIADEHMYLSMERNMECGTGKCGHCQYGKYFICKDGPIFAYSKIKSLFAVAGF